MPRTQAQPFPSTDWSEVARTGRGTPAEKRRALASLLEKYLPPLRSYLRFKWRVPGDRSEDLLQGFLLSKVLEQHLIQRADRARGKFRTFLMTALDRYVVDEYRRSAAAKRSPGEAGAGGEVVSLEALEGNPDFDCPAPAAADLFDVAWARHVLDVAVRRMREHCEKAGREDLWAVFEARVLRPTLEQAEPVPLGQLMRRVGLDSPAQVSNLMNTAKRTFSRTLRAVVGEYAADEAEADEEIGRLIAILSKPGA